MRAYLIGALAAFVAPSIAFAQAATPVGIGFDVEHYAVSLTPVVADKWVAGTEEITFRSLQDGLASVTFSPNALIIEGVTVDGRVALVSSDETGVSIALPAPLARGRTVTISLRYSGVPRRGVTTTANAMFTSYFACDWMICLQDSPGDKATFALDLNLPTSMSSLASGRMAGRSQVNDQGLTTHRWRSDRPYSAYLFGFAVGPFSNVIESTSGGELTYYGEDVTDTELRQLFAETSAMVSFLADKAGLPLPDGRYAQLLTGAREAQEAATYSLIGRGELERSAGDPSSQWVVVHELAHQWWGNLVTAETWQHFWLNEGITTFMTAAWKEHRYGRAAYDADLNEARRRVERAREAGWDRPLAFAGTYPSLGARRAIQYSKGALFLDHLRQLVGDEAFWTGLKSFTRQHAGGVVTSTDFQEAMETAAQRDLSAVFDEWVYG